jgi:hypothetical protein
MPGGRKRFHEDGQVEMKPGSNVRHPTIDEAAALAILGALLMMDCAHLSVYATAVAGVEKR